MTHWRKIVSNSPWLKACDLDGKDVTLHVSHCMKGKYEQTPQQKEKATVAVHFTEGRKGPIKPLGLNVTNGEIIERITGKKDFEEWKDFTLTLYPTTTMVGGKEVECIRIRPFPPKDKPVNPPPNGAKAQERHPGEEG